MTTVEPVLPRGALKLAAEAIEDAGVEPGDAWAAARVALNAALPVIERTALRQAAQRILLLEALSRGFACPACHGKPASSPHKLEGRTGYRCGCGAEWEPPALTDWSMRPETLLKLLARGRPLPELPAKVGLSAKEG